MKFYLSALNLLSLNAFNKTDTELKLMAAAAIIGFNNGPPNNIQYSAWQLVFLITLYPNAQNKFSFIFLIVLLLNLIAVGTSIKSLFIRTISADSIATSVT